ncbi:dolichyl-diphosphooligosaccharide--protein glycosyltransferase subunit 1 [Dipsacomyces acuminosporus]|nr:dolichyl-diphosphooligosaccharide--protein glycosyltransferase subunit 1 [Dipsacomyces acuminosporus]
MKTSILSIAVLALAAIAVSSPLQPANAKRNYVSYPPYGSTVVSPTTVTITESGTVTATATATITESATVTNTATVTETSATTATQTNTVTETSSATITQTETQPARTVTETSSATVTESATVTNTATVTESATVTNTATVTETSATTATETSSATVTETNTVTESATVTNTATVTETNSVTFTQTETQPARTVTETSSATITESATVTNTATVTESATVTNTATVTETSATTATETSTVTESATVTNTATATETNTATITQTETQPAQTVTSTVTETNTQVSTVTDTVTNTATITESGGTSTYTVTTTVSAVPETVTNTVTYTASGATQTATQTVTNTITTTVSGGGYYSKHSPSAAAATRNGLVNTNLIRTINLESGPFVKEQVGVVVQNEHASKLYKSYTVVVPLDKADRLAQLTVRERKSGESLDVVKLEGVDERRQAQLFRATLRKALQPGEKLSLNVDFVYTNLLEPKPKAVKQDENQFWLWSDEALVRSIYPIRKQKTVVHAPGDIKRFTNVDVGGGAKKSGKSVTFGPFAAKDKSSATATATDEVGALKGQRVEVNYLDNSEHMEAVTHRREYFVSHWANDLNVLEHYALRNRGPEIDGPFNKVKQTVSKFMRTRDNFIKTLLVKVPVNAREMYFVDEIGNVSTSAVTGRARKNGSPSFKIMQLKPRYPLPGSWNYTWWHGYSVPLDEHLKISKSTNRHLLKVPFIGSIAGCASQEKELTVGAANAQNVAINSYELRITLPEGASDIDVKIPFAVDSIKEQPFSYYLDSTGRTVVVVNQKNVAPDMHKDIVVAYSYSAVSFWQKPAVIAAVVFALFALASVTSRIHFGLGPKRPKSSKSKSKSKSKAKTTKVD